MAQNLASKYEKQFDEAFKPTSFFEGKVTNKYNFDGAKKISIYSPVTVPLADYQRSGANRYGTPSELDNTLQELELTQDKGFAKTLDRGNYTDSMMAISAGAWMNEQIKGMVTPATEKYALGKWIQNAGEIATISAAPTKSTIVSALADGIQALTDAFVPEDGRYLYVTAEVAKYIALSDEWTKADRLADTALSKGVIGEFMGAKVVKLPTSYFPANSYAFLAVKSALLLPRKISTFKTHTNPPGIDGWLMEGRVYYDAFVLAGKAGGTWALVKAANKLAAPTASSKVLSCSNAAKILYTTDGSDPRYSKSALVAGTSALTETGTIKAVGIGGSGYFTSDVADVSLS